MISRLKYIFSRFLLSFFVVPRRTIVAAACVIVLLIGISANGQTIKRVDGDSGLTIAQGATGDDWNHAFKYLADALAVIPVK